MQRRGQILAVLLVLQIGLAALLYWTESDSGAFVSSEKLLNLSLDSIDKITVRGAENKQVVLQKQKGKWALPDYYAFPASKEKLDRVFGKLLNLTQGWPVATTQSAAKRFKVSDKKFEKKLVFTSGDSKKILYLGSSPGFKKIHARVDGDDAIYAIPFSGYQSSTKPVDWADQSILHLPQEDIEAIEIAGITIKRAAGKFSVDGLAAGETAVEPEIQMLVSKVSSLGFQEVLGKKPESAYELENPAVELALINKSGQRLNYRYGKLKDSEDYVLKPSNFDYYFKVTKYNVEDLKGFDRNKLVKSTGISKDAPEQPAVKPEKAQAG